MASDSHFCQTFRLNPLSINLLLDNFDGNKLAGAPLEAFIKRSGSPLTSLVLFPISTSGPTLTSIAPTLLTF